MSCLMNIGLLIKFNYQKSRYFNDGEHSLRTIRPYSIELIGKDESKCVRGYCYLRGEDRKFAISRITNLVINPKEIEYSESN